MSEPPYNPLDKRNLGESVVKALLQRPVLPLPPNEVFNGAGIYAIYYVGSLAPYEPVASANRGDKFEEPIYVGKAIPKGTRKGAPILGTVAQPVLYRRLREHADSVSQASNLDLADFFCRYLLVDEIWIPLGESLLIEWFAPVWNCVLDGFGIHHPGGGRYKGKRSAWDTVHPGRPWVERCSPNPRTADDFLGSVATFLSAQAKFTLETAFGSVEPKHKPEDFKLIERQAKEEHAKRTLRKLRRSPHAPD